MKPLFLASALSRMAVIAVRSVSPETLEAILRERNRETREKGERCVFQRAASQWGRRRRRHSGDDGRAGACPSPSVAPVACLGVHMTSMFHVQQKRQRRTGQNEALVGTASMRLHLRIAHPRGAEPP